MKEDSVTVPERLALHVLTGSFRFHFQQTGCLLEKWDIATQTCLGGSLLNPQFLNFHSESKNWEPKVRAQGSSSAHRLRWSPLSERVADSPRRELPTSSEGECRLSTVSHSLAGWPSLTWDSPESSCLFNVCYLASVAWAGHPKRLLVTPCRWPALALRGDKPPHQGQETPHPHPNPVLNPLPSRTITLEVLGKKKNFFQHKRQTSCANRNNS